MLVSGPVEARRKSEHSVVDSTEPLPMSVFWLWFPYMLYLEQWISLSSSPGMKSLSTAITCCSISLGFFLSTVIVKVLNKVTAGWLAHDNLNKDKLDYFYYLLSAFSVVNYAVFFSQCIFL